MKKITELKKTTFTTKEIRNEFGQRIRTKVPIKMPRRVKSIQGWPRFGHYLIDLAILSGIIYLVEISGTLDQVNQTFFQFQLGQYYYQFNFIGYFMILIYYTLLESTMGRTLGKFATNSYVIDEYARQPSFSTIFLRSLCRWIPFFAFSCLSVRGWHDKITRTYVVSKTEWEALKKELSEYDGFSDHTEILDA